MANPELSHEDHRRDAAGLLYVYPVLSRRSGGLSIGINLNPNRACNWRCIYCQVEGLVRGNAPALDLPRLQRELEGFCNAVADGSFAARTAVGTLELRDFAISGDGEPTSAKEFPEAVDCVAAVRSACGLDQRTKLILITNGSLVQQARVQDGLRRLAAHGGEAWFKLDRGSDEAMRLVNDAGQSAERALENLCVCAALCPTQVQTALFCIDGAPPSTSECDAYTALLQRALQRGAPLRGVLLYGLARASQQPEAPRLSRVDAPWMEAFASRIRTLGLPVQIHA
ncbi:MAG: radical SAM protein [Planctomycetes bacterium]|nr:radical SAM protein [Planctomycetota bacterium]